MLLAEKAKGRRVLSPPHSDSKRDERSGLRNSFRGRDDQPEAGEILVSWPAGND
jgi:hypothetical protein